MRRITSHVAYYITVSYTHLDVYKRQVLYALVAAVITILVRQFSPYPEGVCFGILIANCLAYFVDKIDKKPHVYGIK